MSIEIIEITKKPLQLIGKCAGMCWGAPVDDPAKNRQRAISCIKSNHGRVLEFPVQPLIDTMIAMCMSWKFNHYVWW